MNNFLSLTLKGIELGGKETFNAELQICQASSGEHKEKVRTDFYCSTALIKLFVNELGGKLEGKWVYMAINVTPVA